MDHLIWGNYCKFFLSCISNNYYVDYYITFII